jgi:polyisoprenoid-binding protein YceI
MKTSLLSLTAFMFICGTISGQVSWSIDKNHSKIGFSVEHLMVSEVTGRFKSFRADIKSKSLTDFNGAEVEATIDVNSIDTENLTRDKHLTDEDFFYAAKYPEIKFKSTSFHEVRDNQYEVKGNLTMRDVTRPVTLIATYNGQVETGGKVLAGFKITGRVNRFDFGLKWNDTLDSGGLVVGEEVEIELSLELVQD